MNNRCNNPLSRRVFMGKSGCVAAAAALGPSLAAAAKPKPMESRFYTELDKKKVQCETCPRNCEIADGKRGNCETRENRGGKLYSLVYGYPVTMNNDPIEKKPFYHVYPGSQSFSIATVGCNMHCKFCQNWEISQIKPEESKARYLPPDDVVSVAQHFKSKTIAYTYTEPTIFSEFVIDCAKAAKSAGLGNVVVSNGYINAAPLKEMLKHITAYKVDLKAFTQQFYGKQCGGKLKPVLETLKRLSGSGVWFEIVVLIIPTLNDSMDEIKKMAAWINDNLGENVPLHFTRFHPQYQVKNLPPTPPKTLAKARAVAIKEGCNFVYTGNMPGNPGENTACPKCKIVAVRRYGHRVTTNKIKKGKCPNCKNTIPGVWH